MKKSALMFVVVAVLTLPVLSLARDEAPDRPKCDYGGKSYSEGSRKCQEGRVQECTKGEWSDRGERCGNSGGGAKGSSGKSKDRERGGCNK